jgi:hypothetical protein
LNPYVALTLFIEISIKLKSAANNYQAGALRMNAGFLDYSGKFLIPKNANG